MQELFKRHHAVCKEAYVRTKKDNDLVHYDKVPDVKTLAKPVRKGRERRERARALAEQQAAYDAERLAQHGSLIVHQRSGSLRFRYSLERH